MDGWRGGENTYISVNGEDALVPSSCSLRDYYKKAWVCILGGDRVYLGKWNERVNRHEDAVGGY